MSYLGDTKKVDKWDKLPKKGVEGGVVGKRKDVKFLKAKTNKKNVSIKRCKHFRNF